MGKNKMNGSIGLWCFLWCCCGAAMASTADEATKNSTRGIDEFVTSLTQMIGTALNSDARYSQVLGNVAGEEGTKSISGRPNRPPTAANYYDTGRPGYFQNGRPYPPAPYLENGGPYPRPPPDFPGQDGRPDFLQIRPPYPYRPRPGGPGGGYPQQNSVLQALTSISQHDDLRCVPRLLCEVSSGTRPSSGYYQRPGYYQQQQQSSIPFLSRDALITLLTVLNFVDDSPLLMFGRAALLGYNARGDPRSCTTAYPTCPRDPDQLINYLNNHNGGFFRFFNQQLPQYVPGQYPRPPQPHYPPFQGQGQYAPPFQGQGQYAPPFQGQGQYAPQFQGQGLQQLQQLQQYFGGAYKARSDLLTDEDHQTPRILSGSPSQYYDVPSVQDLLLDVPVRRPTMTFPSDDHRQQPDDHSGSANSVAPFAFPSDHGNRHGKKIKMVFPDRTGTGGLRADVDKYGNYKGVYYAAGAIKFVDEPDRSGTIDHGHRRPSKIRLPGQQHQPSSGPAEDFDVPFGNRLPYDRRPKFHFPRTV